MLDIGWTELLVIAVILIVVVGPKDLPPMIRAFGKMTKRLRQTAGEFRAQFDEALREAELDDLKSTVNDLKSLNPTNSIRETLNPLRQMGQDIKSDLQKSSRIDSPTPASSSMAAAAAGVSPTENSILPDLPTGAATVPPDLSPAAAPVTAAAQSEPASAVPVPPASKKPRKASTAKAAAAVGETAAVPAPAAGKVSKPRASASKAVVAAPEVLPVATSVKAVKAKPASAKSPAAKSGASKRVVAEAAPAAPVARKPRQKKSEDRA
ncbi:Sec-independent protein translocase protein TatB [Rhizobium wuzhouense]|uniref:Sec-independent protein translocase protein TatB n=1 Tax=Rhizobium wuzhouense TaxID=1986026 RepID=A0ABX5NRQ3_9HYPH|nr:Sec-independent protein translocase protein TatB [Rhizobium wuzhouense]PYB71389.1 twin-arginine translocase subunit TatB [Rhizobium wuzhouense]